MKHFLFPLIFDNGTINGHISKWLKANDVSYFYHYATIYADIFGEGIYYRIACDHVCKNIFEVFYDTNITEECPVYMQPTINEIPKVHHIVNLYNTVEVLYENGKKVRSIICGHADYVKDFYLTNSFILDDTVQRAISVKILDVTW